LLDLYSPHQCEHVSSLSQEDNINMTCLTNPPGSSNAFIAKPNNIAKFAAQYFASMNPEVSKALEGKQGSQGSSLSFEDVASTDLSKPAF